jgi:hypothetical protein
MDWAKMSDDIDRHAQRSRLRSTVNEPTRVYESSVAGSSEPPM